MWENVTTSLNVIETKVTVSGVIISGEMGNTREVSYDVTWARVPNGEPR